MLRRREPNRSLSHRRLRRSMADDAVTIDRLPIGSKQETPLRPLAYAEKRS